MNILFEIWLWTCTIAGSLLCILVLLFGLMIVSDSISKVWVKSISLELWYDRFIAILTLRQMNGVNLSKFDEERVDRLISVRFSPLLKKSPKLRQLLKDCIILINDHE